MIIIGIAGGTGSGKTTVVSRIVNNLAKDSVAIIAQDAYYKDNTDKSFEEREKINYDHPNSIDFNLLLKQLNELKEGKEIQQPIYSYVEHTRTDDFTTIQPKDVVIVEGILVFTNKELRELCDYKIFVHTDADERLLRRARRDIQERGRDIEEVLNRWEDTLKPMHEQFIAPTMKHANIIIPIGGNNIEAIDMVSSMIKQKLSN